MGDAHRHRQVGRRRLEEHRRPEGGPRVQASGTLGGAGGERRVVVLEHVAGEPAGGRPRLGHQDVAVRQGGHHARLGQPPGAVGVVRPDPAGVGPVEHARRGVGRREPLDQAAVGRDGERALGGADVAGEDVVPAVDGAPGVGGLAVEDAGAVGRGVLARQPGCHPEGPGDEERLPGEPTLHVVDHLAVGRLLERVVRRAPGVQLARVGRVRAPDEAAGPVVEQAHLAVEVPGGHHLPLRMAGRAVVVDLLVLVPVDEIARLGGRRCGGGGGARCRGRRRAAGGQGQRGDRQGAEDPAATAGGNRRPRRAEGTGLTTHPHRSGRAWPGRSCSRCRRSGGSRPAPPPRPADARGPRHRPAPATVGRSHSWSVPPPAMAASSPATIGWP